MIQVPMPVGGISFPMGTTDSETGTITNIYEIAETQVTWELWNTVRIWATGRGYKLPVGQAGSQTSGGNPQEPVTMVNWFDAAVWCNALTDWYNMKNRKDLTKVYYYDSAYNIVARDSVSDYDTNYDGTGSFEKQSGTYASAYVHPSATGFRLPSSKEWELAARWRGTDTTNIVTVSPWNTLEIKFTKGNSASGATANYNNAAEDARVAVYGGSSLGITKTATVKSKDHNTLGVYDMMGNVWEWCFDWFPGQDGEKRIGRGASWYITTPLDTWLLQAGNVGQTYPAERDKALGFRLARNAVDAGDVTGFWHW
jgi:formylglycine-generating enzyme required for sulfatase activity